MERRTNTEALERLRRVVLQNARTIDGLPPDLAEFIAGANQQRRTGGERRGCRRVNVCLPIRFRTASSQPLQAAIADLSKGGVFVRSTAPATRGESVAGAFMINSRDRAYQVKFRGTVAWVAGSGAAYPPGPGLGVDFSKVHVSVLPRPAA